MYKEKKKYLILARFGIYINLRDSIYVQIHSCMFFNYVNNINMGEIILCSHYLIPLRGLGDLFYICELFKNKYCIANAVN